MDLKSTDITSFIWLFKDTESFDRKIFVCLRRRQLVNPHLPCYHLTSASFIATYKNECRKLCTSWLILSLKKLLSLCSYFFIHITQDLADLDLCLRKFWFFFCYISWTGVSLVPPQYCNRWYDCKNHGCCKRQLPREIYIQRYSSQKSRSSDLQCKCLWFCQSNMSVPNRWVFWIRSR